MVRLADASPLPLTGAVSAAVRPPAPVQALPSASKPLTLPKLWVVPRRLDVAFRGTAAPSGPWQAQSQTSFSAADALDAEMARTAAATPSTESCFIRPT